MITPTKALELLHGLVTGNIAFHQELPKGVSEWEIAGRTLIIYFKDHTKQRFLLSVEEV